MPTRTNQVPRTDATRDALANVAEAARKKTELMAVAAQIKTEHTLLVASMNKGLEHTRNIGQRLSEVRGKATNKEWREFVASLPFSPSSAYAYIRVFQGWDDLPHTDLKYTDAIKALGKKARAAAAEEQPPPPALDPWQQLVADRMKEFKVKGKLENVVKFVESFRTVSE